MSVSFGCDESAFLRSWIASFGRPRSIYALPRESLRIIRGNLKNRAVVCHRLCQAADALQRAGPVATGTQIAWSSGQELVVAGDGLCMMPEQCKAVGATIERVQMRGRDR